MEILIRILKSKDNRVNLIREFQEYIWNGNPEFGSINEEDILRDLAYDLDFYDPEKRISYEPNYYGDDKLELEITSALDKLGIKHK